jgi:hypothetical protein
MSAGDARTPPCDAGVARTVGPRDPAGGRHRAPIHNSVLIAHRSGNAGRFSVVIRYYAPADPPVPRRVPMVRWTIFTWR